MSRPKRPFIIVSFSPYSRIDIEQFAADLSSLPLIQQPADDLDDAGQKCMRTGQKAQVRDSNVFCMGQKG